MVRSVLDRLNTVSRTENKLSMPTVAAITITVLFVAVGSAGKQRLGVGPDSLELSCGIFTPDLAEADLVSRFGGANVSRGPVFGFDDGPQDGTILFAKQPDARAGIIWSGARREPEMVIVLEQASRWRTLTGITVGTDLRSLERANGRPFRLMGLRIEGGGGGAVVSCPDAMRQVVSNREYSSGHPAFQVLNLRVVALVVQFPRARLAG